MRLGQLILLGLLFLNSAALSAPLTKEQVPEPLKPWVDWALHDEKAKDCPFQYNSKQRACSWPAQLDLQLSDSGGTFTQQWQVFDEVLIRLPGDAQHWPQNVQSEQGELLVESRKGMPYVRLKAGTHTLQGLFRWSKLPKSLKVTPDSGLVALRVNNKLIDNPQFNKQGELWLTQGLSATVSEDNLDIQVFRQIVDSHPVQVVTSIKLRVSGKQRNTNLSPVLLENFIPLSISSPLPARFEAGEGKNNRLLQVQLRPGEWTIEITGRALSDITEFTLPTSKMPWPQQEVWVFSADNKMRQVEVKGVNSIDPNQTRLPAKWKSLPAYLLSPTKTLSLEVLHRGVSQVGQNELSLQREMWLDYDGKGYTIKDKLSGTIRQQSRLNASALLDLGRVNIDGQDQFITREKSADNTGKAGIEIRRESINLTAESRFTGSRAKPPVSGWEHDLQKVNTTLHLPPGWRLLSVSGTDNLPNSWVQKWTLLDFFLVLIITLSVAYLFNPLWAAFALLALAMTWHEPDAPRFIWLNLLAAIALLRILPESWFKRAISGYRWMSILALALIILPYMIDTIRSGLYPQLEQAYQHRDRVFDPAGGDEVQFQVETAEMDTDFASSVASKSYTKKISPRRTKKETIKTDLTAIDPNSMVQTGPGLPNWRGYQRTHLSWSGPVKFDETSHLILIGPFINMLLKFLGIGLLLGLSWRLISLSDGFSWNPKDWLKRGAAPVL